MLLPLPYPPIIAIQTIASNSLTSALHLACLPQRQQLESLMSSAAKQQSLITETERRLGEAQAAADEARDKVRTRGRTQRPAATACAGLAGHIMVACNAAPTQ